MFPKNCRYSIFLAGFFGISGQIILLRQFESVYSGVEFTVGVFFAGWLIFSAAGAYSARYFRNARTFFLLFILQSLVLSATIVFLRLPGGFFKPEFGAIPGLADIYWGTLLIFPYAFLAGALFTTGVKIANWPSGKVYALESIGAAAGGIFTALTIEILSPFQYAFIYIALAVILAGKRLKILVFLPLFLLWLSPKIDRSLAEKAYPGFLTQIPSKYGEVIICENSGQYSVYQNGVLSFSVPDLYSAEESVHFPLLLHPRPQNVLLIGGGFTGSVGEILKHPAVQKIDYCEIDAKIIPALRKIIPDSIVDLSSPKLHIIPLDGRTYVKQSVHKYDVIICALPDPVNYNLNRFHTVDFFREVGEILNPDGIFSVSLTASENFLSPELTNILSAEKRTLSEAFPFIGIVPGQKCHFLASDKTIEFTPQNLTDSLSARNIETSYISHYYLPERLSPERLTAFNASIAQSSGGYVNKDFHPAGLLQTLQRFNRQFHPQSSVLDSDFGNIKLLTICLILTALLYLSNLFAGKDYPRWILTSSVTITGFVQMGNQLLLLTGFQSIFGYMYHQQAVLISAFMIGASAGAYLHRNKQSLRMPTFRHEAISILSSLRNFQIVIVLLPVVVISVLYSAQVWGGVWKHIITLTVLLTGAAGGFQFSLAAAVLSGSETKKGGALYAYDLAGSAIGALAISLLFIPVLGYLNSAVILAYSAFLPLAVMVMHPKSK